jgi:hypothetical protein
LAKLVPGENDLKTLFPSIADEVDGWDPATVTSKSSKKFPWKCSKGHKWDATIAHRTNGRGCPYCSNKKVWAGFNDLQTQFPEIAKEADGWDPSTVSYGSAKKVRWKCSSCPDHQWEASVNSRTNRSSGCPYCSGNSVSKGFNDLQTLFPEIAKEWHPIKNNSLTPLEITKGSHKKIWWQCKHGHEWKATVNGRTGESKGCPVCANKKVVEGYNDFESNHYRSAQEADGWDPSKVLCGSVQKMPWKCELGHKWTETIRSRAFGSICPYCSNRKVLIGFNDIATTFPEIAHEADGWDPSTTLAGSNKKLAWRCKEGHKWQCSPVMRTSKKVSCPYCSNRKTLIGFNDLRTKFPEIAKEADGWDPSTVLAGSNKKLTWRCKEGHTWQCAPVVRTYRGSECPHCMRAKRSPKTG